MTLIHGHTIMQWLADAPQPLTLSELEARVAAVFGAQARFRTCDTQGLTLPELLQLLETRNKIWRIGETYASERQRMCSHAD